MKAKRNEAIYVEPLHHEQMYAVGVISMDTLTEEAYTARIKLWQLEHPDYDVYVMLAEDSRKPRRGSVMLAAWAAGRNALMDKDAPYARLFGVDATLTPVQVSRKGVSVDLPDKSAFIPWSEWEKLTPVNGLSIMISPSADDETPAPDPAPELGDLRIWHIVNPPADPRTEPVPSPEIAIGRINQLADADLNNPSIVGNAFGLEEWDGEEWVEWYSEEGDDIQEYADWLEADKDE